MFLLFPSQEGLKVAVIFNNWYLSEDFFDRYSKVQLQDSIEFIEWSNDYQNYMTIKKVEASTKPQILTVIKEANLPAINSEAPCR